MKKTLILLIAAAGIVLLTSSAIYHKNKYPSDGESFSYEMRYSDNRRYTVSGSQCPGIGSIEINWQSGLVSIEQYDGDLVKFFETSDFGTSENDSMCWECEGNTLKIGFRRSSLQLINVLDKKLTVQVPRTLALSKIVITSDSAKISLSNISVDELVINGASGYTTVSSVSGNSLDFSSSSGAFRGENLSFSKLNVKSASGDIKLKLSDAPGFTACFESESGVLNCSLPVRTLSNGAIAYGDASLSAVVKTVSGGLHLY